MDAQKLVDSLDTPKQWGPHKLLEGVLIKLEAFNPDVIQTKERKIQAILTLQKLGVIEGKPYTYSQLMDLNGLQCGTILSEMINSLPADSIVVK